jgi:5'-phosphate synthase pdxT subunit
MVKIGIISFQGAITEHVASLKKAFSDLGIKGETIRIKKSLGDIDALILPGGESTTIGNLLLQSGLFQEIQEAADTIPIMGTCAGCILLAKKAKGIKTLGIMDMEVERNAFGRQKESFQYPVTIQGYQKPFYGVFIRAPAINRVWRDCKKLAEVDNKIVMAQQGHHIGISFHPELVDDLRIHKYFLKLI